MRSHEDDILMELLGSPQTNNSFQSYQLAAQWNNDHLMKYDKEAHDSLDDLQATDFHAMKQEFHDLLCLDSKTLLSRYNVDGVDSYDIRLPEVDCRKRWDSGYSCTASPDHNIYWSCSPSQSSTSTYPESSCSPFSEFPSPSHSPVLSSNTIPTTFNRRHSNSKPRIRRNKQRQMQLWEFLYDLLRNHKTGALKWEHEGEGVFRIVQPSKLAELWGQHRNRTNMTYEKMSRTLRYYYDKELITKVTGKQHTYKFHYNKFS